MRMVDPFIPEALRENLAVLAAVEYGESCHRKTNHLYDKYPYQFHLQMVADYAWKYRNLIYDKDLPVVVSACWTHDVIEDCRQTYNDVKKVCGVQVAEIVYALTNEKGKNRNERSNDKYYHGIRLTNNARFVKLCDRLANARHSLDTGSSMINAYRKENTEFKEQLWCISLNKMFEELDEILS